jgi:protein gp37
MGDKTAIEWTDATWNPIQGTKGRWSCVKVSEGCKFCYAERFNVRMGGPEYKVGVDKLRLDEEILTQPLRWKRPRRIFVCSMTDLFEERVPDEWIQVILSVMALAGQHTFQVLTKRAERMCRFLSDVKRDSVLDAGAAAMKRLGLRWQKNDKLYGRGPAKGWPLDNVWLGVSVETQERADERIPHLLETPAAVRFLSVEPLLGPVHLAPKDRVVEQLSPWYGPTGFDPTASQPVRDRASWLFPKVDWVIVGGESGGPSERALVVKAPVGDTERFSWAPKFEALQWVRALRDQCVGAGVPFFFKQWGGPTPKSGGRLLDGQEWGEFP